MQAAPLSHGAMVLGLQYCHACGYTPQASCFDNGHIEYCAAHKKYYKAWDVCSTCLHLARLAERARRAAVRAAKKANTKTTTTSKTAAGAGGKKKTDSSGF
ncbi:MAG: hypothetical protein M1826_007586 [Phylliscum demangeonii]|nr:MAG: hypothetical protein M1826_007586 [Phylliscum demangeonii]